MNSINLIGNICNDLELKTTPNGKSVCSFNIAVKRPFSKDVTDFFTVVCWNNQAECICNYCRKGTKIGISGMLTSRSFQDKEEKTRTVYEILANNVIFLEKKADAPSKATNTNDVFDNLSEGFVPVIDADSDLPF